jgi:hypothetical protein
MPLEEPNADLTNRPEVTPREHAFDGLTRELANDNISRSQALRLVIGALLGVLTGSGVLGVVARPAQAAPPLGGAIPAKPLYLPWFSTVFVDFMGYPVGTIVVDALCAHARQSCGNSPSAARPLQAPNKHVGRMGCTRLKLSALG